ncbi:Acetylcholinesterase/Butyrylcholinesterase [Ceraceosorus bombacis]|uniref:Carboxylic ester hydrolase n=1 Tax=Ceraceosorus bombacis TaxID=401625 RepID=A0A0P1B9I8_9BASI|nr:Acetylcholinesterase/Butyrylcholinesterase [Ceraceosorus bombacis]
MLLLRSLSLLLVVSACPALSASIGLNSNPPSISLGQATVVGSSANGIESFRALRYGKAPVGKLRFMPPVKADAPTGVLQATQNPPSCRQMPLIQPPANPYTDAINKFFNSQNDSAFAQGFARLNAPTNGGQRGSEDCLFLNVHRPVGTKRDAKLPVLFWMYGGGFQFGSLDTYEPTSLIQRSVSQKQPMIYVSINYRVAAYGFLGGPEIKSAGSGNMGLRDQRLAMEWVHDNIAAFGGDPSKVTIWGESAGAISAGLHLVSRGQTSSKGLGSPYGLAKTEDVTRPIAVLSGAAGCNSAPAGRLACLQALSADALDNAMNQVPGLGTWSGVTLAWPPTVDGDFIPDTPDNLVAQGKFNRDVAIVNGDNEDEGTILTTPAVTLNTTDDAGFKRWVREVLYTDISEADYQQLAKLYPNNPADGSPYGTGLYGALSSQNKRVASIFGDATFQAPRKRLLKEVQKYQPRNTFSYNFRGFKYVFLIGSFHASELLYTYGFVNTRLTEEFQSRFIAFVSTLNPNFNNGQLAWPVYGQDRKVLTLDELTTTVQPDNQRDEPQAFLDSLALRGLGPKYRI